VVRNAGYDRLETVGELGCVAGSVTLTARLVDAAESTHTVELTAELVSTDDGSSPRTLVRGSGRTLHVAV